MESRKFGHPKDLTADNSEKTPRHSPHGVYNQRDIHALVYALKAEKKCLLER